MIFRRQLTSMVGLVAGIGLLVITAGSGCSASSDGVTSDGSGGAGGAPADSKGSAGDSISGGNGDEITPGTGPTDPGNPGDGSCAASQTKAELVPLDMYIMLDKSGSMGMGSGRWEAVTGALGTFLKQPESSGIGVGIQFFPLFAGGDESCKVTDYAKPAVEIASLPDAADNLISTIGKQAPNGGTPTSASLTGAIQHAKAWATEHPTHITIAVLATDGEPQGCDENLSHINAIAANGVKGTPKILTYVIGVGSSLKNLDGIAAAGGTGKAFLVDTSQNPGQQFLDAMNKIRGTQLACSYVIPTPVSGTPDFNAVNVQYTPGTGGAPELLPKVQDKASCGSADAWYYDDNSAPTQIILCEGTCSKLSTDIKGQVDVLLGCTTVVK